MTTTAPAPKSTIERTLAAVAIGIAVMAFGCLAAVLLAPVFGVPGASMVAPAWQATFLIAYWGLPVAFLLLIGLVVARLAQNRRQRPRS